jgi:glycosyltransferase involved in cell wall biosynthesis
VIYVLIPAFNEARNLETILPRIPKQVFRRRVSIVVICDGSTDGTCRVGAAHGAEVVKLTSNQGKGSAVRAGAALLKGRDIDAVVTMDGDGQHNPHELSALVGPVLTDGCDLVIGSRYLTNQGRGRTPLNRFLVRTLFTRLLQRRLRQPVTDPFTGFRCMSPRAFSNVMLRGDRYEGELEVRFEAERVGLKVIEVPIERIYSGGQSKMAATGGRLRVIRGYATTVRRKTKELERGHSRVPVA